MDSAFSMVFVILVFGFLVLYVVSVGRTSRKSKLKAQSHGDETGLLTSHELDLQNSSNRLGNGVIPYEQNSQGIAFILDENICSEISSWNRQHLSSQLGGLVLPLFELTLLKDESDAVCIQVEQVFPRSPGDERFKQVFAAQLKNDVMSTTSIKIRHPYLNPLDYKLPAGILLYVNLDRYHYLIYGWQDWTWETALSGRYTYGFGEIYGDPIEDGYIEDNATGELLSLTLPMALSE
jgi:hypothetical protein